jgi:uncharacterized protein (TIGR00369 family)
MTTVVLPPLDGSPYQRFLGVTLISAVPGRVEMRLPFRDELLREDGSDWLHGGVVGALVDIAGDYAVASHFGCGVPTVDLRIDYLRPSRRGDLQAVGQTIRVGKTLAVADVEVRDGSGQVVATGRGVYACPRQAPKP